MQPPPTQLTQQVPPTSSSSVNTNLMNSAAISHLLTNGSAQQLLQTLPQMLTNPHIGSNTNPILNHLTQPLLSSNPSLLTPPTSQGTNKSPSNHFVDNKIHASNMPRCLSPSSVPNNNRMYHNGELSISTVPSGNNSSNSMKRSPSSLSPNGNESSTADLLVDSPSKYLWRFLLF